jgi:hypothetical protein
MSEVWAARVALSKFLVQSEAKAQFPWALVLRPAASGWLCFESAVDYDAWRAIMREKERFARIMRLECASCL